MTALIHSRRGAIGLMFALMLVPMMGCLGLCIDYGMLVQAKTQLNTVADSAALAASRAAAQAYAANPNSDYIGQGNKVGNQWIQAGLTSMGFININAAQDLNVVVSLQGGNFVGTATYSTTMDSFFARVFNINQFQIGGNSVAVTPQSNQADFYLLLDDSNSMGIPASADDMPKFAQAFASPLNALWDDYVSVILEDHGSCALACHENRGKSLHIRPDKPWLPPMLVTNDGEGVARLYGITLRIDVLKSAIQTALSTIQSSNAANGNATTRAGLFTFDDGFHTVHAVSNDLGDVITSANTIDLEISPGKFADTYVGKAMLKLNTQINTDRQASGSSNDTYLLLVTDGTQDIYSASAQDNLVITPINTTYCDTLKNNGVQIYILWTEYVPLSNSHIYSDHILADGINDFDNQNPPQPLSSNKIQAALQACASSSNTFFKAQDAASIQQQMQNMVQAALVARRTRLSQ